MLNNLHLEKVWINDYCDDTYKETGQVKLFSHTVQFYAVNENEESNEIENGEPHHEEFSSEIASKSILRFVTNNQILGLEADSLEIIPGDCSSTDENDLNKVFFKVANHPFENQLDLVYYLGPWEKCSIRFSFLCQKRIDISTIDKMNVQEWIIMLISGSL